MNFNHFDLGLFPSDTSTTMSDYDSALTSFNYGLMMMLAFHEAQSIIESSDKSTHPLKESGDE